MKEELFEWSTNNHLIYIYVQDTCTEKDTSQSMTIQGRQSEADNPSVQNAISLVKQHTSIIHETIMK